MKFNKPAKHLAGNCPNIRNTLPGEYLQTFLFSVSVLKIYQCIQLSHPPTVNVTAINPGADVVDLLFVVLNQESHSQPLKHPKWWAWQLFQTTSRLIAQTSLNIWNAVPYLMYLGMIVSPIIRLVLAHYSILSSNNIFASCSVHPMLCTRNIQPQRWRSKNKYNKAV